QGEKYPAGAATVRKPPNSKIFTQPSANMAHEKKIDFFVGFGFFRKNWVEPPSATAASDGLGPLYNSGSCVLCHVRDGRGHPPDEGDNAVSMFLRLSIPPQTDNDKRQLAEHKVNVIPEPTYGGQLQNAAITGQQGEGRIHVEYKDVKVSFADGETVTLRKPTYSIKDLGYGKMHPDVMLSPRIAPPMIGLGLLEAISETDILLRVDIDDKNADGISGKPNQVWSLKNQKVMLGRFGYKAGQPSVDEQNQDAAFGDIGLSVPLHPHGWGECTAKQMICRKAPDGASPQYDNLEAPKMVTDLLTLYSRNLAVPKRRKVGDANVLAGKKHFYEAGCIACHQPKYKTPKIADQVEQSEQLIWPYTDLLLHDMGEGLSDNRPEGDATGREWRTAPLWGVGLATMVSKRAKFLHDGRARNIQEAILWHGGEAQGAKSRFMALKKGQRDQLLLFVKSL
ncbi:MAG: c-type cytochrome, partial [Gammaproteobacteria bacterium]|nr:c-type cytochrome [Gammaproteobacteria bacterium]